MKTPSQLLVIFLLIDSVLTGCTHSRSPITVPSMENTSTVKGRLLTFDLRDLPDIKTVKLSDFGVSEIEYIPLKTTTKTVIPPIGNIIFSKNYFLTKSSSCINMFRYDGTFVTEIGTNGRGPNEYIFASDVDIDPKNESIYIGDGRQSKFLVIDKDGKVVRTFKSPQTGYMMFKFIKDGILCYYDNFAGNIENSFILIDTTGKIIRNFPNKYPLESFDRGMSYGSEIIFYTFNNQIFKKEIYCDTIFLYNNKVFEPHLIIDVGDLRLTPSVRTSANGGSFSEVKSTLSKILLPINLFEFSDFIFYSFSINLNGKNGSFSFIGSKKNNFRAMFPISEGLINDFDGGPNIMPKAVKDDNTLVSWIDAFEFKKHIASDAFKNSTPEYPEKKKELEKLADSIKENDNPIMILIKVR
jgi:hypothetical protein